MSEVQGPIHKAEVSSGVISQVVCWKVASRVRWQTIWPRGKAGKVAHKKGRAGDNVNDVAEGGAGNNHIWSRPAEDGDIINPIINPLGSVIN